MAKEQDFDWHTHVLQFHPDLLSVSITTTGQSWPSSRGRSASMSMSTAPACTAHWHTLLAAGYEDTTKDTTPSLLAGSGTTRPC